jgi:hypothetical protein
MTPIAAPPKPVEYTFIAVGHKCYIYNRGILVGRVWIDGKTVRHEMEKNVMWLPLDLAVERIVDNA